MQAKEHTGCEGVSGANGPRNERLRHVDASLHEVVSPRADGDCSRGKMDHNPLAHTGSEQFASGLSGGADIDSALADDLDACRALGFKFVQDTVIAEPQRRTYDSGKSIAVLTHHIHTRLEAGFPRALKHGCCYGSVDRVGQVEPVEQAADSRDERRARRSV